ncbi:hypothetical protein ACFVIY_17760 [Streptomyces sp. NPDC127166]|uniref:hypothetical protein n=1 Tax=Streptomyces sp. NPDC127166 TaxID=3345380 RepID=UPI0036317696
MSKPSITDRLGIALHNGAVRVAGAKGAKAAAAVSDVLIGRHLEECDDRCGNCGETEMLRRSS